MCMKCLQLSTAFHTHPHARVFMGKCILNLLNLLTCAAWNRENQRTYVHVHVFLHICSDSQCTRRTMLRKPLSSRAFSAARSGRNAVCAAVCAACVQLEDQAVLATGQAESGQLTGNSSCMQTVPAWVSRKRMPRPKPIAALTCGSLCCADAHPSSRHRSTSH